MRQLKLSSYIKALTGKRLSAVETDPSKSNQHELNGSKPLQMLLGVPVEKRVIPATLIYVGPDENTISVQSSVTWYDARENHPTRTEYRLYYKSGDVVNMAAEGDLLLIALTPDDSVILFIIPPDSKNEQKVKWLFSLTDDLEGTVDYVEFEGSNDIVLDFSARKILESFGIEIEQAREDWLDSLLRKYIDPKGQVSFPRTKELSALAQSNSEIDPQDLTINNVDEALMKWWDLEESLFRRLENHFIQQDLEQLCKSGSGAIDVDKFISTSLSIQNRRKSRAGHALENHLETIFGALQIHFTRGGTTENNAKPDFLFPGVVQYHSTDFNSEYLTMLGVKTTCKDRWRQVLAEADKIPHKHLLTLEPAISSKQTDEMKSKQLQLVVPELIHSSYTPEQQEYLYTLTEFTDRVIHIQKQLGY